MRSIFNSLGSNYSLKFVATSLRSLLFSKKSDIQKLVGYLESVYAGEVLTLYKGRDAIEACCRVLLKPGSKIITQAFSCYAIEEGITRAGMVAVYADIAHGTTNMSVATISAAYKKNPDAKAVLIQHSLGIPADSIAIKKWCDEQGLLLIEDVAQGIGGIDTKGKKLGACANAVIFSFGKDKIIDAVSGGAVVFRTLNDEQRERLEDVIQLVGVTPFWVVCEDMIYPDVTSLIRKTHHIGIGKVVFTLAKRFGLLGSPIESKTHLMTWMHPAYARLAVLQFMDLEKQLEHRRKIVQEYFKNLRKTQLGMLLTQEEIMKASNLRFNIRCKDISQVNKLISALKHQQIYVPDRWYRRPVDCGAFARKTVYQNGSCPEAELLADTVLNLPTHREIDSNAVKKICDILLENI